MASAILPLDPAWTPVPAGDPSAAGWLPVGTLVGVRQTPDRVWLYRVRADARWEVPGLGQLLAESPTTMVFRWPCYIVPEEALAAMVIVPARWADLPDPG